MAVRCGHCKQHHATPYDVYLCSLPTRRPVARQAVQADPWQNKPQLITPVEMIKTLRNGRYAVRPDSNAAFMFIRVTRPTSGKWRGYLKVQTQHSDWYKDCIVIRPDGELRVIDKRVDSNLLLIVADPVTASRNYGRELNRCCSCGRELTDERSRWYGIGPECEKRWPEIINQVDEEKGHPYYPGCNA